MTDIEYRSVEIRAFDEEKRTIEGIAVPYGQTAWIPREGHKETFERGAFGDIENVKLYYDHKELIGLVTKGEDLEEGFRIEARISKTERGNEVYELLKDGALNRFSVGFVPVEDREENGVVVRTKAVLKEVSVTPFPIYQGAQVLAVRTDSDKDSEVIATGYTLNERKTDENMSEINYTADIADLRGAVEEIERRFEVLGTDSNDNAEPQFRSGGDFIKALAEGDENAANLVRAYTGATSADSHVGNDWKNNLLVVVNKGRPVFNLFTRGPLGASGNTVEYPKVSALTGDVASQAAEGDDLAYLEVAITTETAPVLTYGGYSQLTRQAIERSDVSYLDTVLKHQAASYAKVTNAAVRSALVGASAQTGASFTLSTAKGADYINTVVDAIGKIEDNALGAQAEFVIVSRDVYAAMATLADTTDRPLFNIVGDGSNTIGNANVRSLAGSLAGLPVVVDAGLAAKTMIVASSEAVTSWESAGAPVRLQDENIINLSKDFSLYGYLAVGVTNALALVKADIS